jgi:hypothetical protein
VGRGRRVAHPASTGKWGRRPRDKDMIYLPEAARPQKGTRARAGA